MGKKPRFSISSWTPSLVKIFLKVHGFEPLITNGRVSRNGDEVCWVKGKELMVAFSETRRELTPGTMRDSVMRQSGYSKKHWDPWSLLSKTQRKRGYCCKK